MPYPLQIAGNHGGCFFGPEYFVRLLIAIRAHHSGDRATTTAAIRSYQLEIAPSAIGDNFRTGLDHQSQQEGIHVAGSMCRSLKGITAYTFGFKGMSDWLIISSRNVSIFIERRRHLLLPFVSDSSSSG